MRSLSVLSALSLVFSSARVHSLSLLSSFDSPKCAFALLFFSALVSPSLVFAGVARKKWRSGAKKREKEAEKTLEFGSLFAALLVFFEGGSLEKITIKERSAL